jgi:hypothetical protein
MRALLAGVLLLAATVGCGKRQVKVTTAPKPAPTAAAVMVHFTNNDNSAVNVYVVNQGSDLFLKQIAANSTEDLPVAGIASGTQVRLKATRTDGSKTYTSDPMALTATTTWRVP